MTGGTHLPDTYVRLGGVFIYFKIVIDAWLNVLNVESLIDYITIVIFIYLNRIELNLLIYLF